MNRAKFIFCLLNLVFVFILIQFFVPLINELFQGSELFLLPMAIFCLLGILLIIFSRKIETKKKRYFMINGFSAAGFLIFVILHNVFYAFAELSAEIIFLKTILEFMHGLFFIIGLIVCPLAFIVSSLIIIIKKY